MESDLNGINWTTTAQYLKADAIIRRNSEFHLWDISGTAGIITDGIGAVIASDLYDSFGMRRASAGSAQTVYRMTSILESGVDNSPEIYLSRSGRPYIAPSSVGNSQTDPSYWMCFAACMLAFHNPQICAAVCIGARKPPAPVPPAPQPSPTPGFPPPPTPPPGGCAKDETWVCQKGSVGRCIPKKEAGSWFACCTPDGNPYVGKDESNCSHKGKPATAYPVTIA